MNPKPRFNIVYLEEAEKFLQSLDGKTRMKIQYNIFKSQYETDKELLKKLNDNIWEFRTRYNGLAYRMLAFWDKKTSSMVVATHGFVKKSQKTPLSEIRHAESIMKEYNKEK